MPQRSRWKHSVSSGRGELATRSLLRELFEANSCWIVVDRWLQPYHVDAGHASHTCIASQKFMHRTLSRLSSSDACRRQHVGGLIFSTCFLSDPPRQRRSYCIFGILGRGRRSVVKSTKLAWYPCGQLRRLDGNNDGSSTGRARYEHQLDSSSHRRAFCKVRPSCDRLRVSCARILR